MIEPSVKDVLYREIARLDEDDRRRVLEYAQSLRRTPRGAPGASLLSLAGSVSDSDMTEIEAATEEGCEKVNPGAW
ncbi:MAG: hypothetical protein HKN72_17470 [Gemmatimonadetes bacterium]|nr:hypothetical protein [Gemmatimonadota bacterium]